MGQQEVPPEPRPLPRVEQAGLEEARQRLAVQVVAGPAGPLECAIDLPAGAPRTPMSDPEDPPADPEKLIRRAYSLASPSLPGHHLELFVTLVRSGELTPRLFAFSPFRPLSPRGVCIHERFEEQVRRRPGDPRQVDRRPLERHSQFLGDRRPHLVERRLIQFLLRKPPMLQSAALYSLPSTSTWMGTDRR